MSQFLVLTVGLVLLVVALAAVTSQTLLLLSQVRFLRVLLQEEQARSNRLTNLLQSKDAMTYATLTQVQSATLVSDPYAATGTDEAEFAKWQMIQGVDEEYDPTVDFAELGVRDT